MNSTDEKSPELRRNVSHLKPGRKPAVTPEIWLKLLEFVKKGYTVTTCCNLCGISNDQFKRALKNKENLLTFSEAESLFLASVQDKIIDSATKSIDGARWLLERRLGEEFTLKNKLELSDKRPLNVVIKRYAPPTPRKAK